MAHRDSKHETWVRDLNTRLTAMYQAGAPRHVLDRMGMLLGYRDVMWIDGQLDVGRTTTDGTIILFTEHLVAVAELKLERNTAREANLAEARTDVSVFPRRSLRALHLLQDDEDTYLNSVHVWEQLNVEIAAWPDAGEAPLLAIYDSTKLNLSRNEGLNGEEQGARLYGALVSDLTQN